MRRAACDMIASARRVGARVIVRTRCQRRSRAVLQAGADLALIGEGLRRFWKCCRGSTRGRMQTAANSRKRGGIASLSEGAVLT